MGDQDALNTVIGGRAHTMAILGPPPRADALDQRLWVLVQGYDAAPPCRVADGGAEVRAEWNDHRPTSELRDTLRSDSRPGEPQATR